MDRLNTSKDGTSVNFEEPTTACINSYNIGHWVCPRCNSVYSSATSECPRCNKPIEYKITC